MSVLVMCTNPACGELFDAPDHAVGRRVKCPACGTVQLVTAPADDAAAGKLTFQEKAPLDAAADKSVPTRSSAPAQPLKPDIAPLDEPMPDKQEAGRYEAVEVVEEAGGSPQDDGGEIDLVAIEPPHRIKPVRAPAEPAEPKPGALPAKPKFANKAPEEIKFSENLGEITTLLEDDLAEGAAALPDRDGILEHKMAGLTIFILGLLGMGVGVLLGLLCCHERPVAAMYSGAALGWIAGLLAAFLLVLNADKSDTGKVRCAICGNVFAIETEVCRWCGSKLTGVTLNPLASQSLKAGSYGISNLMSVFWMVMLAVLGAVGCRALIDAASTLQADAAEYRPVLYGICGLLAFGVFSGSLRFLLDAINETLARSKQAPSLQNFFSSRTITAGLLGPVVLALYTVPIVTFPLLPLGLLSLASPRPAGALDVPGLFRLAWRHAKDFAILWLMLVLWLAAMGLAMAVAVLLDRTTDLLPSVEGQSKVALEMVVLAVRVGVVGVIVFIFGLALSRCIGVFGRFNGFGNVPNIATVRGASAEK